MCKKMTQEHQSQSKTITVTKTKQESETIQNETELFRPAQQAAQETVIPGQALAQAIAGQLPAGGNGVEPPLAPPAPMQEAQAAPSKKKQRQLQKRLQEEARRQEEADRIHLAEERQRRRAEAQREEEEKRQARRRLLLEDAQVRALMEDYKQEQNPELAAKKAEAMLRAAGKKILDNDEEMADVNAGSVDYVTQLSTPFRLLIATQVEDQDTADALLEKNQEHAQRFAQLGEERPVISVANRELLNILKEERGNSDFLDRVALRMSEDYDRRNSQQLEKWNIFESVVARNIHMTDQSENAENIMKSGSPFHYLSKAETIAEFDTKTRQVMAENPNLTYQAAEKQVCLQHRRELEEAGQARAVQASVVHDVSAEDWRRHGGASFHQVMPAYQAHKLVKSSNGFLYAKPAGNGLCELHPTLPKTVKIGEETVSLRRSYTLLVKAIMHNLLDENGSLRENARKYAEATELCLSPMTRSTGKQFVADLRTHFKPAIKKILGDDEEQAEKTIKDLEKLIGKSSDKTFPPIETLTAISQVVDRIKAAGPNADAGGRFDKLRENLEKEGLSQGEIDRIISRQVNPAMVEQAYRLRQAFIKANGGSAPLTREQEAQISALYSLYADIDKAMREMRAIREMDPDSPDTPMPNACSANAAFIEGIRKDHLGGGKEDKRLTYHTSEHVYAKPFEHIDFCKAHLNELVRDESKRLDTLNKLHALEQKLRGGGNMSTDDWKLVAGMTSQGDDCPSKYTYHMAGNVGKTADGIRITSEGFAAESKQYLVTPFSRQIAVGLYHGPETIVKDSGVLEFLNDGMVSYYNKDHPLPTEEEAILASTKEKLASRKLFGDQKPNAGGR